VTGGLLAGRERGEVVDSLELDGVISKFAIPGELTGALSNALQSSSSAFTSMRSSVPQGLADSDAVISSASSSMKDGCDCAFEPFEPPNCSGFGLDIEVKEGGGEGDEGFTLIPFDAGAFAGGVEETVGAIPL